MAELSPQSDAERRAITSLKRLAKRWPPTLGLWGGIGDLVVVRMPDTNGFEDANGKVHAVETIHGIPAGGGDPDWAHDG